MDWVTSRGEGVVRFDSPGSAMHPISWRSSLEGDFHLYLSHDSPLVTIYAARELPTLIS
jgi:hypothetical protein